MQGTIRAIALLGALAVRLHAQGAAGETQDLRARLEAAEEKIRRLEEERSSPVDLRKAVDDYLASTAQAPSDRGSAGYDGGFFVRSRDGRFLLRANAHMQFRFVSNHQEETLGDPERHGFENTRTKLLFTGHAWGERWTYRVETDFDVDGGRLTLRDAHITRHFDGGWAVQVGQCKCPVLREERVDARYQLAAERSNVNDVLTSGERFGGGVAVSWSGTAFRAIGMFSDGDGTPNTPALAFDTEYALTFRGEWLAKGQWFQFEDFTSFRGHAPALLVGFNFHTQKGESGTPAPEPRVALFACDVNLELDGANAFVEFVYVNLDTASAEGTRHLFGVIVQSGGFVTATVEPFARFEWATLDDASSLADEISVVTVGVNKYIERHAIKLTLDFQYAFEPVPAAGRYSGLRADTPFGEGQAVVRVQVQLVF